jgi:hypothetical protein
MPQRERFLVANISAFLQTTLAAEAHLAEAQFLLQEQTLNTEKFLTTTTTMIIIIIIIQFYNGGCLFMRAVAANMFQKQSRKTGKCCLSSYRVEQGFEDPSP